jgi:acylphosphatase
VVRKRVIVLGEVQGVYFRDTCRRVAAERRVAGWVRNLPDGAVEAVFEGEPDGVGQMVDWAHRGPSRAQVDSVEVYDEEPEGLSGFRLR